MSRFLDKGCGGKTKQDCCFKVFVQYHPSLANAEREARLFHLPDSCRCPIGKNCFAHFTLDGDTPVSTVYLCINEQSANLRIPTGKSADEQNVHTVRGCHKRRLASALL